MIVRSLVTLKTSRESAGPVPCFRGDAQINRVDRLFSMSYTRSFKGR